jgi:hypothetical protein
VLGFSADFSIRCPGSPAEIRGAFRFRAGDAGCAGAADGTPCDDRNACTGSSSCRDGLCVGAAPVACAPTSCREAPVCDPASGTCALPAALPDGTRCDDAAACVVGGTCDAGACVSAVPPCDDFDVCTADACGGAGCVHEPIDGTCWQLRGTATFVANVRGATCSCTTRATPPPLALNADGTFARPGGVLRCEDGRLVVVPNETGSATPSRRGRLELETANLDDILDSIAACQTVAAPRTYRGWVKVDPSGTRLRGQHVEAARTGGLRLKTILRYRGTPTGSGTVDGASVSIKRCTRQLVDCLRHELTD